MLMFKHEKIRSSGRGDMEICTLFSDVERDSTDLEPDQTNCRAYIVSIDEAFTHGGKCCRIQFAFLNDLQYKSSGIHYTNTNVIINCYDECVCFL